MNGMPRPTTLFPVLLTLLVVPRFLLASVAINEILFDPAGTDTGLEKIEFYNPDVAAADLSSWELYPDGIGYFLFPGSFSLQAKSFVVIHLRTSGTDDAANLYHSSPTSNMGNSSGSVAIFKPGGRSSSTIADFVRYHKPGSSESKTWESAAVAAGLWTAGEFVDVNALTEGNSIGLVSDGVRSNAAAWKIYATPTIGGANSSPTPPPPPPLPPPPGTPLPPPAAPPASSGGAPRPSLGADAGSDTAAVAGTIVPFLGIAFGLNGEPLPGARFLWNFGDGEVKEGKSLTHIYHFPGTYRVNLTVSSGEYTGSDWRVVSVLPPMIEISEVKPGAGGFVELFNNGEDDAAIGGMNFLDGQRNVFGIPVGTVVGGKQGIVFANALTALNPAVSLTLRDARLVTLESASFTGVLPSGASWERSGGGFAVQHIPTPGAHALLKLESAPLPPPAVEPLPPPQPPALPQPREAVEDREVGLATGSPAEVTVESRPATLAAIGTVNIFFAASIIVGLAAAVGFVLLKRKFPGRGSTG